MTSDLKCAHGWLLIGHAYIDLYLRNFGHMRRNMDVAAVERGPGPTVTNAC
jgi:hypothetical protein